ncbi:hypothetical protein ACFLVI_03045 [Chloroflexota bacterium]
MKRRWFFVSIALGVAIMGIALGCAHTPDDQPWASYASKVALRINIAEGRIFDAFDQALKEGEDILSDRLGSGIPTLTDEDVVQIQEWYQNSPDGCTLRWFNTLQYFGVEIQLLYSVSDKTLDGLASRVALILELDEQKVIAAFHQVSREFVDEMHREGLDRLIDEGRLTEEQVDRYYQWYLARPDAISPGRMGPAQ